MCNLTLGILENEFWWGGAVNHGYEMPFHRDSCIFLDLRGEREGDQYAPLFLSSCGRYIWSEKAFTLRMENGSIRCEGEAAILPEKGFSSLKGAYLAAMRTHFPFVKQVPDRRFLTDRSTIHGLSWEKSRRLKTFCAMPGMCWKTGCSPES